jgi:hypothetical protein
MGGQLQRWLAATRGRLLSEFADYPVLRASDRIFYDFSVNRPMGTRMAGMPRYTPLTEPDLVSIGVNQPLMRRLDHGLHRRICSTLDPAIASVPTDRGGLNMSGRLRDQPCQWSKYVRYQLACMGLGRFRGVDNENRNRSLIRDFVLASDDLKAALETLKRRDIVRHDFERPSSGQAKRLLMLYYLFDTVRASDQGRDLREGVSRRRTAAD